MYVEVKGDSKDDFERALKHFSKIVKKNDIVNEVKRREFYVTPSKKRILKRQDLSEYRSEMLARCKRERKQIGKKTYFL